MIHFTKMHGIGNDYIFIDDRKYPVHRPDKLSINMSDRHKGAGSDGLILIMNSDKADFRMRMFNSDGSEAEMCGNGIRCFAKYVHDRGHTDKKAISIETPAGIKELRLSIRNGKTHSVTVNMGEPILRRDKIPMIGEPGMVLNEALELIDGINFDVSAVSMGNPHAVIFVEDVENFPVEKYGPFIENHQLFPQRTNVEFAQIVSRDVVIQRTWERGSGETMACGTGASAVTVAAALNGLTERKIKVILKGGELQTEWSESDNHVYLTGPAVEVYDGVWLE